MSGDSILVEQMGAILDAGKMLRREVGALLQRMSVLVGGMSHGIDCPCHGFPDFRTACDCNVTALEDMVSGLRDTLRRHDGAVRTTVRT